MELIFLIIIIVFFWYQFKVKPKRISKEIPYNKFDKTVIDSTDIINHNFEKLKKITEKKISQSYLTSCNWILQSSDKNIIYTFRNNNELLISNKGIIDRLNYELIIDNNSILITKNNITELYNIVNIKNDFLFLNKVSTNENLSFLNHTKIKDELKKEFENSFNENLKSEVNLKNNINYNNSYNEYELDALALSKMKAWEEINPDKNILDYIAHLEGKSIYDSIQCDNWIIENPGNNFNDYFKYLQYKNLFK